jgi:hypothetical protein
MTTSLTDLSLSESLAKLKAKEISSVELTQAYLDQIAAHNDTLGAYLTVETDTALNMAKAADAARANGEDKPLLGRAAGDQRPDYHRRHTNHRRVENPGGLHPRLRRNRHPQTERRWIRAAGQG